VNAIAARAAIDRRLCWSFKVRITGGPPRLCDTGQLLTG
jgi:hypothetical protein